VAEPAHDRSQVGSARQRQARRLVVQVMNRIRGKAT